ncbi:MAG: AMP-binding protein, partial [Verrucomicrobiota bacterium]
MSELELQPLPAPEAALTASEMLIWLGQSHLPETPLYNVILEFRIQGGVDEQLFREAFEILTKREPSLRTVFRVVDGEPQRQILTTPPSTLDVLPEKLSHDEILELCQERSRHHFDLGVCLYDSWLVHEIESGDAFWTLNIHHLANDSGTFCLLEKRLAHIYTELENGEAVSTSPFPSFSKFAQLENQIRQQLPDSKSELTPTRFYRPSSVAVRSESLREERVCSLIASPGGEPGLTGNLEILSHLATALAAWLYRIEQRTTFTVGLVVQHRNAPQLRETAGLFIEILPFEFEIDPQLTFSQLRQQIQGGLRDLIGQSRPGQVTPNSQQRFDVVLNLITGHFVDFAGRSMTTRWLQAGQMDPNHRLCLHLHDYDRTGSAHLVADFNLGAFPETWDRNQFWSHFESSLGSVHEGANSCANFILDEQVGERTSAQDATENPGQLETLIFEQAEQNPDRLALVADERRLTFRELAEHAEGVAKRLRDSGVAPGEIVLSHFGRELDAVVANLGILRAGGVFCPLPPETPPERFEHMLRESRARHVLCNEWTCDAEITVHQLDDIPAAPIADSKPNSGDAAYVLFTSGSTGWPKGVLCRHSSVLQLLDDMERRAPLPAESSGAWWTAPSFDVSIYEVFSTLCFG